MAAEHTLRRVGIVFALDVEKAGLERALADSRVPASSEDSITTYAARGAEAFLIAGGIGPENASAAARRLCEAGVDLILSSGFAAALDPGASTGDVLTANHVIPEDSGSEPIECSASVRSLLPPSGSLGFPIRLCNLAAGGRVLSSPEQKRDVFAGTGAVGYDMESYAVGRVCKEAGIPFGAIRCVTDSADQPVPDIVGNLLEAGSVLESCALVAARPQDWPALIRLRRNARLAANHLGDVLGTMLVCMV